MHCHILVLCLDVLVRIHEGVNTAEPITCRVPKLQLVIPLLVGPSPANFVMGFPPRDLKRRSEDACSLNAHNAKGSVTEIC